MSDGANKGAAEYYIIRHRRSAISLALIATSLLPVMVLGLSIGSVNISIDEVINAMKGLGDETIRQIVLDIRAPRTLSAMLVGSSLSISGLALQSLFRNPLAEPHLLGIAAAASLGATIAVFSGTVLGQPLLLGPYTVSISAFISALAATTVIYVIAKRLGFRPLTLLLLGISMSFILSAISSLMQYMANKDALIILTLLLGSFSTSNWLKLNVLLITILASAFLLLRSKQLNAILLGEDYATQLGVSVKGLTEEIIVVSSLLTAVSVATAGIIGFMGIIVPHIAKLIIGYDHKFLIPFTAMLGALILSLSDLSSRVLLRPAELPVGIVTSLIGAPILVYLLFKYRMR